MTKTTIFRARKIITMNRRQPVTHYVAVRDGFILGTGPLEQLAEWGGFTLDERFAEKILTPGFVEGHCHSWEGSAWLDQYVGHIDRIAPDRVVHRGLNTLGAVLDKLKSVEQVHPSADEVLMGWGFDPLFLDNRVIGAMELDQVSSKRPVAIVHQSGHTVYVNSVLLARMQITSKTEVDGVVLDSHGQPTGELRGLVLGAMAYRAAGRNGFLDLPGVESVWRFARSALNGGVTTAADMGNALCDETVHDQRAATKNSDFPLRLVPAFLGTDGDLDANIARVNSLVAYNHASLRYGMVKLIVDGSIQAFTARLKRPGYFNGAPNGLWYIEPGQLSRVVGAYHKAGLQVHIHTNGDEAIECAIDALEQVLKFTPNADARFTLQHCQMAHDAHFKRMSALGICANLFANHVYYWGDEHQAFTLGPERAERMNAAFTASRLGVPCSLHTDAPVTHLAPLFSAWCAVNRRTASGKTLGPAERLTVAQALYAITLGAAYTLKLDHEIGSIECGKRADFTVLENDPFGVHSEAIKDIDVWGTVVSGRVFQCGSV